uniref:Maturase K n=3 Tax=Angiopteris TaxID=3266 RepID=MATK_ANGEV|nr:maturase K [Angiopteris yunnanensis]YP_010576322.1 maturase K [Angiopteris fokiensis]A2T310.1 RecName: Full=Maturase K; AltName: Full=Intron maturase [Angiopteris evecta]CCQ48591.1 maturase K [Angiopteris madagascariensis]ABG79577.1 maturase K [Angiopteris evecta]QNN90592.1 maturase K [Angiopteris yunnanensis]UZN43863.1 maturase K [Angiopteris fokiensis]
MKNRDRILVKIDKLREKRDILCQQRFLYTIPFQEDIYAIAYTRSSKKSNLNLLENSVLYKKYSVITIKRLITQLRQQNFLKIFFRDCYRNQLDNPKNHPYNKLLLEGLILILEVFSPIQIQLGRNEWKSLQSIHSLFLFMENKFLHSNFILDIKIPQSLHPEILIRIFRRRIQDTPFLHLSRSILHEYQDPITSDTSISPFSREQNSLLILLWNYYVYEFEYLVVSSWKRFSRLQSIFSLDRIDRTHFDRKIKHVIRPYWIISSKISSFTKNPCIHYVRYKNHSVLAFQGTNYLAKKWRNYLLNFWQYHFHCWVQPHRIFLKRFSRNSFSFLGYILGIRTRINKVQAKMEDELPITCLITKELCPIIPFLLLVNSLARGGFCTNLGRPVSKLSWTTLTDDDILKKFDQIWRSVYYYYSGSINNHGLFRLRYIFRFSCAKTLACKHKSTTRIVWKRFSLNSFLRSFLKKPELVNSSVSKYYLHKRRFWYLDIIQINPLTISLRERYN